MKLFLTGLLHAIPNDETSPVKEAVKLHKKPAKKNGVFPEGFVYVRYVLCGRGVSI